MGISQEGLYIAFCGCKLKRKEAQAQFIEWGSAALFASTKRDELNASLKTKLFLTLLAVRGHCARKLLKTKIKKKKHDKHVCFCNNATLCELYKLNSNI